MSGPEDRHEEGQRPDRETLEDQALTVTGEITEADRQDPTVLQRIQRANVQGECGPKLNPKKDAEYWLSQPGSPKAKVNEKPKGETVDYDKLIQAWREGRVK